jgi:hypothetical protein
MQQIFLNKTKRNFSVKFTVREVPKFQWFWFSDIAGRAVGIPEIWRFGGQG